MEHFVTEIPVELQLPARHLTFDAQPVGQRRLLALPRATAFPGRNERRALVELLIELAQIIEGDARLRRSCQRLIARQITQHAVTDAFIRHATQLLFDGLDRIAEIGRRQQTQRIQAGEPADAAGQVDVVEQLLPAMAFQLNQSRGVAGPVADNPAQDGQQQVIDLGAIRRRSLLQQLPGALWVQTQADASRYGIDLAAVRIVARQVRRRVLQLCLPIRQLSQQRRA